nr:PREDICTED: scavenger receptor cysteine-rich type 1 protein M130-like [Latimeria chalumnae]|eukprot:XP_014347930.1 PREDICTED: scavenger receptor cysteine-rich type 1 protein M130-like [Latimeria chalumnae]
MPGVLGAMDCIHIGIITPREEPLLDLNHKRYYSINVQMICNAEYNILNVVAKFPGSTHDIHIWSQCGLSRVLSMLPEGSGHLLDKMELRLWEINSHCGGAVEVYYRGVWGSVCSQSWDLKDAAVVCKQLGCGEPEVAPLSFRYSHVGGPIWLNRVQCTGNESSLWECQTEVLGHHECNHWMDAGVFCKDSVKLVLANGSSPCAGRVEFIFEKVKETASDTTLDMHEAEIACQQLHYGAAFGEGAGPIWGDRVDCRGNESIMWECPFTPQGLQNCTHENDAAVICSADLDKILTIIPKKDKIILLGDFNVSVGWDSNMLRGTIGKEGVGKANPNGILLLQQMCRT